MINKDGGGGQFLDFMKGHRAHVGIPHSPTRENPARNVMKSSLSKQSSKISNLFQQNKRESALRPINTLII